MIDVIERIELIPLRIKLSKPFVISLGRIEYAENLVVRMVSSSGLEGIGECCPFRTINGESLETALVVGEYLKEALIGQDYLQMEQNISRMDQAIYGNRSVKSAFDIALHDLCSKKAGKALYEFLGGTGKRELITDYTVSIGDPEEMAESAREIISRGFPAVKVKVGGTPDLDRVRISRVREAVPWEIPLRLDANQGWTAAEAIDILSGLDGMNIEFCEEPIARWDFMNLPEVRQASQVPVMADESCCDHYDLQRLIRLNACDYVNIKLGKSGGLHTALKMVRIAEQAGMKVQVGGFVESRLGFTASAHLAMAAATTAWCDFDTPMMLSSDPVSGGIEYLPGGRVVLPDGVGLGASLAQENGSQL